MTASLPMPWHRTFVLLIALALAFGVLAPLATPAPTRAVSPDVVISQVYGGGGNAGATYTNDFIELYNRGATAVDVSSWSVQYASAAGTSWARTNLTGTIQPGTYYLVQQAAGTGGDTPLPTPDATGTTAMSATAGKVALVTNQATLPICGTPASPCLPSPSIRDFVGYGSTASEFETAPTPTLSNTTAALRAGGGATDTDNNAADFTVGAPTPRSSQRTNPTGVGGANPSSVEPGQTSLLTVRVTPGANPTSTGLTVRADLSTIDGSATQPFFNDATNGDVTAGDDVFSYSATVGASTTLGPKPLPATIADAEGRGGSATINLTVIAPPDPTEIHEIQGAGHISPLIGQEVFKVEGIVTAVRPQSFYMTDPTPDDDDATSDGVLVFRGSATGVTVGDRVLVHGRVAEFRPGGETTDNLTTTELTNLGPTTPLNVQIVSHDNALPLTLVGTGGRVPPNQVIDDDSAGSVETAGGTFDPAQDGIDFWESLEGQYLRINNAVAVGPTSDFGEIPVIGDGGANAGPRTSRGGVLITRTDFNPERIILDDAIVTRDFMPNVDVGDRFTASVFGVLDYDFGNFKLLVTTNLVRVVGGIEREVAAPTGSRQLSIATFNVENLDPNPADDDGVDDVARLGALIAHNLAAPDLLAIEEIQDNSGGTNDGTTAADLSWGSLIAAIQAAGGPVYQYRQIDPVNNADGGQPGGNIRVGFLFRTDRGLEFVDRPGGTPTTETEAVAIEQGSKTIAQLTFSPGRIGTDERAFNSTRKPLAAEFRWRGETIFVIANHFSSKGGDDPLFGRWQPPVRYTEFENPAGTDSDGWRHGQAQVVNDFVDDIVAIDPDANVVVLGDINDFQFSQTVDILTGAADASQVLTTLFDNLPLNEQYSYVFEGNSQVLDQILVSDAVRDLSPTYDVVHVNAEFSDQASDHDPSVMRVSFQPRQGR